MSHQQHLAVMQELIDWGVCFPSIKGEYDKLQIHNRAILYHEHDEGELKTTFWRKAHEYGRSVQQDELWPLKDGDQVYAVCRRSTCALGNRSL